MNRFSGALATLVACAVAVLGMAVLAPSSASAAGTLAPKVGSCHTLKGNAFARPSDTKKPVPCSKKHTLQTYAVVTPTAPLGGATLDQLAAIGTRSCEPAWQRYIHGRDLVAARTILARFFFTPTPSQVAAGQSWVRCDVGLAAKNNHFASTKGKLKPLSIVNHSRADKNALCANKDLGRWSPCTAKHAFRNIAVFAMPGAQGAAYPSDDAFAQAAGARCPKATYYFVQPSEDSWNAGIRHVRCWKKD